MAAQLWSTWKNPALFTAANYVGTGGVNTRGPAEPLAVGDGLNMISAIFSTKGATVTASVSDVIVMALIPELAIVVGGTLCGKTGTTTQAYKVGIGAAGTLSSTGTANDGVFLAATTVSATRVVSTFGVAAGLPYAMPAIAAATYPKWYPFIITVGAAGTMTVSLCLSVTLLYQTANQGAL